MIFKNFKIQVIMRSVLIALALFGLVYAIYQEKWYVTSASLFILSVLLVANLIHYVEKTRRDISNFLFSVNLRDFTSFADMKTNTKNKNKDLNEAFRFIASEFQYVRIEKELHYQYLQTVIGHVDTALLCFDKNGKVALINEAARNLFKMQSIQSLDFLKRNQAEIAYLLEKINTGEQKLLKIRMQGELLHVSVRATEFRLQDKYYKLLALQDIRNELESKELESWQKLIRVLTHEIMNSVTPITSLSQAVKESLEDDCGRSLSLSEIGKEDLEDIHHSILTIENRSKGLLRFVETYKNLTKLPKPEFEKIRLDDLLNHVNSLMQTELEKAGIDLQIQSNEDGAVIYADHDMIVRVLINLITNAKEALINRKDAVIQIHCQRDQQNRMNISIKDNGKGMDASTLENIFIPFFTTKEKGSGIGLSLCRQIMHLHKGSITAESQENQGTTLLLKL